MQELSSNREPTAHAVAAIDAFGAAPESPALRTLMALRAARELRAS